METYIFLYLIILEYGRLQKLISSESNPETDFESLSFGSSIGGICSVDNNIWCVGERLSIIDKDHTITHVTEKFGNNIMLQTISFIDNEIWILNRKSIDIYDINTREVKDRIVDIIEGNVTSITKIAHYVWLTGSIAENGVIWVIDPVERKLIKKLTKHKGEVYHVAQIGNLAWSVSWDCNIFSWNIETLEKVKTIPNLHVDAISFILTLPKQHPVGYQVWTGSFDRTINVLFVPNEYEKYINDLEDSEESVEIVLPKPNGLQLKKKRIYY